MKVSLTPTEARRKLFCQKKHSFKKELSKRKWQDLKLKIKGVRLIFIGNPSWEEIWPKANRQYWSSIYTIEKASSPLHSGWKGSLGGTGGPEEAPEGDYRTSNSKPRQINKTFALFYQNTHSTVDFKKSFENLIAELAGECYLQAFPKGNISKDFRWHLEEIYATTGKGRGTRGSGRTGVIEKSWGGAGEVSEKTGHLNYFQNSDWRLGIF